MEHSGSIIGHITRAWNGPLSAADPQGPLG